MPLPQNNSLFCLLHSRHPSFCIIQNPWSFPLLKSRKMLHRSSGPLDRNFGPLCHVNLVMEKNHDRNILKSGKSQKIAWPLGASCPLSRQLHVTVSRQDMTVSWPFSQQICHHLQEMSLFILRVPLMYWFEDSAASLCIKTLHCFVHCRTKPKHELSMS